MTTKRNDCKTSARAAHGRFHHCYQIKADWSRQVGQMARSQVVGNAGMYFAAYRLSRRGWNVMPTSRNARGIDLLAYDAAANSEFTSKAAP